MADVKNNATGAAGADGLDDTTDQPTLPTMGGSGSGVPSSGLLIWPGRDGKPHFATTKDAQSAIRNWYKGDPDQFRRTAILLDAAGYSNDGTVTSVFLQWDKAIGDTLAVGGAANNGKGKLPSDSDQPSDPMQFLFNQASNAAAFKAANAAPKGPGAYTGPTSSTQLTPEFDANAIVDNAISQYLGRDATDAEKANFYKKLNKAERENPTVSTPNGKHSTTTTGGFGSSATSDLAKDQAYAADDYVQTTQDTTLMSWFDTAIQTMKQDRIVQ